MTSRKYQVTYRCCHPGCNETGFSIADTRAEEFNLLSRQWKCCRHSGGVAVLSPQNRSSVYESMLETKSYGKFFGSGGFVHGPGFKVFAEDFPDGTVLRVTAEIILPETTVENSP